MAHDGAGSPPTGSSYPCHTRGVLNRVGSDPKRARDWGPRTGAGKGLAFLALGPLVLLVVLSGGGLPIHAGLPVAGNPPVAVAGMAAAPPGAEFVTPLLPFPSGQEPVDTLFLGNNTLVEGNVPSTNEYSPQGGVNDTINGDVYFPGSNGIAVFDPRTDSVVTTISVPGYVEALTFDPANGALYGANVDTDQLVVVNGTTNTVTANVAVGSLPQEIAIDPLNAAVYVTCAWSASVSVISTVNNTLVANLSVGSYPGSLAVDSSSGQVFVGNTGSDNISVISATNESVVASVALGAGPGGETFDPANGLLYVALGSKVDIVNTTSDTVASAFGTGSGPKAPFIDPANGELYIPCYSSSNITVYSPTTGKVVASITLFTRPIAWAYDPVNKDFYVTEQPPTILPIRFQVVSPAKGKVIANISGGEYIFTVVVGGPSGSVLVADYGLDDIEVVSPTTNTVTAVVPLAYSPVQAVAVPGTGEIYVGDEANSAVEAISDATGHVAHRWQIGSGPSELAYDPANRDVYVVDEGSSTVSVISTRTNSVVKTLGTGGGNGAVAVDPVNGLVYIANSYSNNLTVINGTTNRLAATISMPTNSFPWELGVDTSTGNVYVGVGQSGVSVISGKTNAILTNISVGPSNTLGTYGGGDVPLGITYDPASNDIYVVAFYFNDLTVISGANNSVVAVDPVGSDPEWTSLSSGGQYVYVSNFDSANVTVVNASTNRIVATIPTGAGPGPVLDDPARGLVYVANSGSSNVSLVDPSNFTVVGSIDVGNGSDSFAIGPSTGNVWVANGAAGTMSILAPPTYPVVFNETGLPAGTAWAVTLDGLTETSNGSTIQFNAPLGANDSYSVPGVSGFTWSPDGGILNVTGANLTIPIRFHAAPDHFLVTFEEGVLPPGTIWSVSVNGSLNSSTSGASLGFSLLNGTGYTYGVTAPPGLRAVPAMGTFGVLGAPVNISLGFGALYGVSFQESGLPSGTTWTVHLNGTSGTSNSTRASFEELNGTYSWSLDPVPGYSTVWSGKVTVDGANASVAVPFVQVTYRVTFAESGLPTGTWWNITLGSTRSGSQASTIQVPEPNGTFAWTAVPIAGYMTNWSGSVTVDGAPATVNVTFVEVDYSVFFVESGLPSGTPWSVTTGADQYGATAPTIGFVSSNGTYPWQITPIAGYSTTWSGVFVVRGADVQVNVTFARVVYSVDFQESGLPIGTVWTVHLNGSTLSSSTSNVDFELPNGTYAWSINPIRGVIGTWNGTVSVAGQPSQVRVAFNPLYDVTFTESGLPSGWTWWVNLTGGLSGSSATETVSFQLANGSYPYTVAPESRTYAAAGGTLSIDGSPQPVAVSFAPVTYRIGFTENGLPAGTHWQLTLAGGATFADSGSTLADDLTNGSYSFTAATSDLSYQAPGGSFTVQGAAVDLEVNFTKVTFDVVFEESGLPAGTDWSVELNGVASTGMGNLTFTGLSNGTYSYTVGPVGALLPTPSNATVTVRGAPATVSVSFVGASPSPTAPSASAPWVEYEVLAGAIAAIAVIAIVLWRRSRSGPGAAPGPSDAPAEPSPVDPPLEGEAETPPPPAEDP